MATTEPPQSILQSLPLELLLEIFSHLLAPLPTHYSYTHAATDSVASLRPVKGAIYPARPRSSNSKDSPLRTHGILLANHQLSADYMTAFYARTNFFFYINAANAKAKRWWTLSPSQLPNVRSCKVYIEAKQIKSAGVDMAVFVGRVHKLLGVMERLRQIQLVWDLAPTSYRGHHSAESGSEKGTGKRKKPFKLDWEGLGDPFVEVLKQREGMREFIVTVGGQIERFKRERGGWLELGDGVVSGSRHGGDFPFL